MATGTIKGTKTGYYGVEIDYSSTTSVADNTSTVVSKVYITYYSINIDGRTGTSSVNSVSKSFSTSSINHNAGGSYRRLVCTRTDVITHNTDGKKSITISASFPFNLTSKNYGYIGTLSASKTIDLDTIPRASTFTVSSSINTGSSLSISITKASSSYRHRVELLINGSLKHISDYFTGTTWSYFIPHSWVPNKTSETMSVKLYTYTSSGTSSIGTSTKTITINVPSNIMPRVTLVDAIVNGLEGYYVQGKSSIKLTATGYAGDGATVSSYTFYGQNINGADNIITQSSNIRTSSIITTSGNKSYYVRITDSRGRYADSEIKNITVHPYATPSIKVLSIQRCLSNGVLDNSGTYAAYSLAGNWSVIDGKNTRTITVAYSDDGGETYSASQKLVDVNNTSVDVSGIFGNGALNIASSYKIKFVITDKYTSTNVIADLSTATRPINFAKYGNGIAIGGMSSVSSKNDDGLFEVNWDTKINADMDMDGNIFMGGLHGQKGELAVRFSNPSDCTNPHDSALYGGNPNSKTDIGIWDALNNRGVFLYESSTDNNNGVLFVPTTSCINETIYNANSDSNETNLNNWLSAKLNFMPNSSLIPCKVCCYPAISGTSYSGFLFKHNDGYAHLYGKDYFGETIYKPLQNGVWQNTTKYSYKSIDARLTSLENRHVNEFSSISINDLPNKPSGWSGYGRVVRWGIASSSDKYYLLIDSSGKLFTGIAMNNASTITWAEK